MISSTRIAAAGTGVTGGRTGLSQLRLLFAVVFALGLIAALPSAAGAFGVANFSYVNSSLQAAGHPDSVAISFERQGTQDEDLKDVQLDLPAGVFANPEAANPKCSAAQFASDTCPASSHVGDITAGVTALNVLNLKLLSLTIKGTIDVIAPDPGDVATLGFTLRPDPICVIPILLCARPGKIFLKNGVTIRSYGDSGLRNSAPNSPSQAAVAIPLVLISPSFTLPITIEKLALKFNGRANEAKTGPYFWTQTGSCTPATSTIKLTSTSGQTSSASTTFLPTGCQNVPFDPSVNFNPAIKDGGKPSPVTFSLDRPEADLPIQHSLPKITDVDFPNGSGLNLDALSGVTGCTDDELRASACPASSKLGTAFAFSKFLPGSPPTTPGLAGTVWAMGVGNQIPIAVELHGPRGSIVIFRGTMGTRGDANAGDGRVYATFDRVPQLPFRQFSLTIDKPVYTNPSTCGPATSHAAITGFNGTTASNGNGTVVNRTTTYNVVNCAVAPETTITSGPPSTSPLNVVNFEFTSSIPGSAFQCRMDAAEFGPCTSPFTSEPLSDGSHTFQVRALNGPTADATPASDTFTVDTQGIDIVPTINVSTTQAVAHPDVSAQFAVSGGQPRTISLRLPNGFDASLSAVPTCASADAALGNCTSDSKVGTATLTVDTFGGSQTGTGDLYLTDGPTGNDAGGIATKITFPFGNFIAQGGAFLVNNGQNQYLDLREIPAEVNGTAINVTRLDVQMSGANSFLTNPSDCSSASEWVSTGEDYAGNTASVFSVPFQATGCASVPFHPTITQTLTSPVAGTHTGVLASIALEPENSAFRTVRVSEPPSLAPNFPAFGTLDDQCPDSAAPDPTSVFDPSVCPPQSIVGYMEINTPLLPTPLFGVVYLINKSPLPWLGVAFDQPGISVRLTGVTSTPQVVPSCNPLSAPGGFCQTQISVVFNNLPDVPIRGIDFTLDGPPRSGINGELSGQILRVASPADSSCDGTTPARSVFTPFNGGPDVALTQNITITGCT
jgi:hypothetical protein